MKRIMIYVQPQKLGTACLCWIFWCTIAVAQNPHANTSPEIPLIHASDQIIHHLGYTVSYHEKYEQANWVAYELTDEETVKKFGRTNQFMADPDVTTGSATNEDYEGSGYDRGHLAPAADMGWSQQAMSESFYFSNMSPQTPSFNRGIWKKLEEQVRDWAVDYGRIYIATGPVFSVNMPSVGPHQVAVPPYYYKVILDYHPPEIKCIGFVLPNEASSLPLQHFAVPIDSVEKLTHLDFFPNLPDRQEIIAESKVCIECWSWSRHLRSASQRAAASSPSKQTVAVQCHGITQKGNRCKKMTRDPSGFCNLHLEQHR